MLNGLYGSASALDALSKLQEATAANLAHLNTPGHRRLIAGFSEMVEPTNKSEARPGSQVDRQTADFSAGRLQQTGRSLDIALQGDAFFMYQGANGIMYSRNGALFLNPENNELVNSDGFPILDSSRQPIRYTGTLADLVISADGSISNQGQSYGRIGVASFDDNQLLESENQTYFRIGKAVEQESENVKLVQGARELSNTNPVTELISLIVCSRHFEATQRALRTISDSMHENTRG